jgi:hypothetical protein
MRDELKIMNEMVRLLDPLDATARARAVAWVIDALGIKAPMPRADAESPPRAGTTKPAPDFPTFAELFHAAGPTSEREKALVAGYWIQQLTGASQFSSQQINNELKHIGYRVSNITDALSQLIGDKPSLAIQLTKSGQSKQARKTYKITDAGLRYVFAMLNLQPRKEP